jgi:hypothetical protein
MGLLSRVLKTPDDDSDEAQEKLEAEEGGLFMASSSADKEAADAPPEPGADAPPEVTGETAAGAEGEAQGASPEATGETAAEAEGVAQGASPEEEGKPAEAADDATSGEPAARESATDSDDDPLAAFRSTAGQRRHAQTLHDDLEDVPAAELLAEARSILDALGGASQGSHVPGEAEEKAA